MNETEKSRAWADFWRDDQGHSGGCLAGAGGELGAIQALIWQEFAGALPKGARVLDLGTGDGTVLKQMARKRPDLKLAGVDSAPALPPAAGKLKLLAGVGMEALPFADSSVGAVVSQFGYEYGATLQASYEIARVLRPQGPFLLLVHRRDGPVVEHNARRSEALRWAVEDSQLIEKAKSLAEARRAMALPTPASFREAAAGAVGVAAEIAQAVLQALSLRPPESLAALAAIERKAKGELLRLDALAAAARDEAGAEALAGELRSAGLEAEPPQPVSNRSGRPFAWKLSGRRP